MYKNGINELFYYINESQLVEIDSQNTDFMKLVMETQDHIQMVMSLTDSIERESEEFENLFELAFQRDIGFIGENISSDNTIQIHTEVVACSDWIVDDYLETFGLTDVSLEKELEIIKTETRLCFINPEDDYEQIEEAVANIKKLMHFFPKTLIVCNQDSALQVFKGIYGIEDKQTALYSMVKSSMRIKDNQIAFLTGEIIRD
jgi:hypothetical protein